MSVFKGDFGDLILAILLFVLAFLVIVTVVLAPFSVLDYYSKKSACGAYAKQTDRVTKFVDDAPYWWSCQVKTTSGWIDYNNLKQVETPNVNIESK